MGLMTSSQANACTIVRMEKRTKGSDIIWVIGVKDSDGNYYDSEFTGLASDASKSDIKTAMIAKLVTLQKQPAPVSEVIEDISNKGIGETLG
tara:strand:- start:918 stop:1193 length:276 start_codon:yes stop_codon:yes gene_type:complete